MSAAVWQAFQAVLGNVFVMVLMCHSNQGGVLQGITFAFWLIGAFISPLWFAIGAPGCMGHSAVPASAVHLDSMAALALQAEDA